MKLDFNGSVPLHVQVKEILTEEIVNGNYKDKIQSEPELMERFSISRTTVREAISILVNEGFLEKKHGKGTFISIKPLQEWLGQLRSFHETVKNMGMTPSYRLLDKGPEKLPENLSDLFNSQEIYLIVRLLCANDVPVAIEKQYYPVEIGYQLGNYDLNKAVLYDLLESDFNIALAEAKQMITGDLPTKDESDILGISKSRVVLRVERLIFDTNDKPVEYLKGCFRSDMYSFRIKMLRKQT
jgi:GntR family transcriptional regulator